MKRDIARLTCFACVIIALLCAGVDLLQRQWEAAAMLLAFVLLAGILTVFAWEE